jgi:hypothetical protein
VVPVSPYGYGRDPADGLLVPFVGNQWLIPLGHSPRLLGAKLVLHADEHVEMEE